MERRGEGFERERYVPDRERHEAVERERLAEPRTPVRPSEPQATYDERYGRLDPGIVMRTRDLTSWGPVIGGFFASLALMVLLGVLGAAIGLQVAAGGTAVTPETGIGAAIWGAITLAVSFFVGGWLAGRTASIAGPAMGLIHGFSVWALTVTILLVIGAAGLAGVINALTGGPAPAGAPGAAMVAGWGTFGALIVGLAFALLGGWVGGQNVPSPRAPSR